MISGSAPPVRTGHGTTDWFQIGKGVHQGCILSPCVFNLYAEYIMRNMGLDETQAGIKIAGRNINNLRFADDTWHPIPVLLPGKSHGWRSLVGCSPWGREELDKTQRLHFHFSLSCIGEGNGNPLQCSCLENPRARGASWAAVYGVAQSQTRLKQLSSSSRQVWRSDKGLGRKTSWGATKLRSSKKNQLRSSKFSCLPSFSYTFSYFYNAHIQAGHCLHTKIWMTRIQKIKVQMLQHEHSNAKAWLFVDFSI